MSVFTRIRLRAKRWAQAQIRLAVGDESMGEKASLLIQRITSRVMRIKRIYE
jgi:hypothetical protein